MILASPSCPYGFSLNDFDSFGEVEEAYPKGRHRNAKHSAATTLQPLLLFDALEWRSKVEFRPGHAPQPSCTTSVETITILRSAFENQHFNDNGYRANVRLSLISNISHTFSTEYNPHFLLTLLVKQAIPNIHYGI